MFTQNCASNLTAGERSSHSPPSHLTHTLTHSMSHIRIQDNMLHDKRDDEDDDNTDEYEDADQRPFAPCFLLLRRIRELHVPHLYVINRQLQVVVNPIQD